MRLEDANRERLVQFLRDKDAQRAKGFQWDFADVLYETHCGSAGCAVGAAIVLGIIERPVDDLCLAIGLPNDKVTEETLFYGNKIYGVPSIHSVTASMVADKIEQVACEGWGG